MKLILSPICCLCGLIYAYVLKVPWGGLILESSIVYPIRCTGCAHTLLSQVDDFERYLTTGSVDNQISYFICVVLQQQKTRKL